MEHDYELDIPGLEASETSHRDQVMRSEQQWCQYHLTLISTLQIVSIGRAGMQQAFELMQLHLVELHTIVTRTLQQREEQWRDYYYQCLRVSLRVLGPQLQLVELERQYRGDIMVQYQIMTHQLRTPGGRRQSVPPPRSSSRVHDRMYLMVAEWLESASAPGDAEPSLATSANSEAVTSVSNGMTPDGVSMSGQASRQYESGTFASSTRTMRNDTEMQDTPMSGDLSSHPHLVSLVRARQGRKRACRITELLRREVVGRDAITDEAAMCVRSLARQFRLMFRRIVSLSQSST